MLSMISFALFYNFHTKYFSRLIFLTNTLETLINNVLFFFISSSNQYLLPISSQLSPCNHFSSFRYYIRGILSSVMLYFTISKRRWAARENSLQKIFMERKYLKGFPASYA